MTIKAHRHIEETMRFAYEEAALQRPIPVPRESETPGWSPKTLLTQLFKM